MDIFMHQNHIANGRGKKQRQLDMAKPEQMGFVVVGQKVLPHGPVVEFGQCLRILLK